MQLNDYAIKHQHSVITAIIVLIASLLGFGLFSLVLTAGFWAGREHAQAEYRYMNLYKIKRDKLGDLDGFKREAWNYDSLVNDLALPILTGGIVCGLLQLF